MPGMISSELVLVKHESMMRFGVFFGILVLIRVWETLAPCRRPAAPQVMRWFSNVGLLVVGTAMLRAIFPLAAVGVATIAQAQQWGLFYLITLAPWQTIVLSIIFLDFATYLQHILFHTLPILWRFHKIHHADLDFDVTTGLRFHPIEILLSMVGKATIVVLLGAPAVAVLMFELILNATSMFNHGNVRLPANLEPVLRLGIVTPDMHRIHHSSLVAETNSNFGFNIPWWDHLFGTYRASPAIGHQEMPLGLAEYENDLRMAQLPWMLLCPLFQKPGTPVKF